MNGSLKLTLAVALALSSTNALALGLGMIQVRSGLNEPLVAEIPVTGGPDETASLSVALAAAADFERVGLSRARIVVPLEFTVATGAKGNSVIKVTTKEPVRDPFLDFLIEVNWAKGKLLREYTVLLDPPTMAPAIKGSRASTAPVRDGTTPAASTQLPATKPAAKPARSADTTAATAATAPAPAPTRSAAAGEYGPVAAGETLWEVAAATRPDDSVSVNQVMVSLLRANPNAFFRDNINSLKRGAILRVPSADEIRAAGSAAAAAAEVRSQNEAARGGGAAPTLVADSGSTATRPSSSSSSGSTPAKPSDRLELVPPKTGKDVSASAERPGAGGTGDAAVRAELARTKEALTSSNQEAGELKSRVRELEELKTKNDKLLSLKDSELAALQQKLRELQDKAAKPAASSAAATPSSTPATTATATPGSSTATVTATKPGDGKDGAITKEEIWGSPTPATGTTPPATSSTAPSSAAPGTSATSPSTTATTPATTTPPSTTTSTAPATTPADTAATTPPATPPTDTSAAAPASTTTTAPATSTPSTATTPPAATTPAKPATSTTAPAKPATPAKVQPLPAAKPWYMEPTTWMYGLGGLAVLGALGFVFSRLRGKKAAPAAAGGAAYAEATSPLQDEEDALLDRLAQYPDDTSAHLELTSLYYSQGDADKFEAAAQAMYAHIYDTNMPEWQQVQAMGRELVPSNPLFADAPASSAPAFGNYDSSPEPMRFDGFDDGFGAPPAAAPAARADDDAFDFDLADRSAPPPPAPRDDFSFDLTPPVATPPPPSNYQTQVQPLPPIPDLTPPSRVDDDLLASDDAIGTKLDLAKAYLDMGDPDGARSMLEEVMIEGSESQKGEARKLLAEIR